MANYSEGGKKPIYKKWWFWLIIIIVIVGIGGSAGKNNSNDNTTQTSSSTATQQNTKTEELLEVDYKVLYNDYQENPISADTKYKGKILKLTGIVDTIDREIAGNTYITFKIDYLKDIRITFKKSEESKVAELKKGQSVTIKGECTGTLLSTTVALNNCEIIDK